MFSCLWTVQLTERVKSPSDVFVIALVLYNSVAYTSCLRVSQKNLVNKELLFVWSAFSLTCSVFISLANCPAGSLYVEENETCAECPFGTYQPVQGQTRCIPCGTNLTTAFNGTVEESDCIGNVKYILFWLGFISGDILFSYSERLLHLSIPTGLIYCTSLQSIKKRLGCLHWFIIPTVNIKNVWTSTNFLEA